MNQPNHPPPPDMRGGMVVEDDGGEDEKAQNGVEGNEQDELLKVQLGNLGFHVRQIQDFLKIKPVDLDNLDAVLDWFLLHPASDESLKEYMILDIMDVGFNRQNAKGAIEKFGLDLEKCVSWLSEQSLEKEAKLQQQKDLQEDAKAELLLRKQGSLEDLQFDESPAFQEDEFHDFDDHFQFDESEPEEIDDGPVISVRYGGVIMLQSAKTGRFLYSKEKSELLNASIEEIDAMSNEECHFTILFPSNLKFDRFVSRTGPVALQASDKCWVAAEVDGSVNSNRTGPVGLFGTWKLKCTENKKGREFLSHGDEIVLESALHHQLETKQSFKVMATVSQIMPTESTTWIVWVIKAGPEIIMSEKEALKLRRKSVGSLWSILKSNYRLAALRMRNRQVLEFREQVERERRRFENEIKEEEESECIICWSAPRTAVILECGHICVCEDCASLVQNECPLCRKPSSRVVLIK